MFDDFGEISALSQPILPKSDRPLVPQTGRYSRVESLVSRVRNSLAKYLDHLGGFPLPPRKVHLAAEEIIELGGTKTISHQQPELIKKHSYCQTMVKADKIRIVVATKFSLRHKLFLSRVCELFSDHLVGVFIQEKEREPGFTQSLKQLARKGFPDSLKHALRIFLPKKRTTENYEDYLREIFASTSPDYWKFSKAPVYFRPDINSGETQRLLLQCNPDLILVFGGTILKDGWIAYPSLGAINLHTGILPYYRSCNSTLYALYHENYHQVGSTVHYIDEGVDTGPIISRQFVNPFMFNNYKQLKARIFADGINGLLEAAEEATTKRKRLKTTFKKMTGSYYSHADYAPFVGKTAELRLNVNFNTPWPAFLRTPKRPNVTKRDTESALVNGIYIFLFHGVYNSDEPKEWEKCLPSIQTSMKNFTNHLDFLCEIGTPLRLSDVPAKLKKKPVDQPYFVITFDDGYTSLIDQAMPICEERTIKPTVFVCANFADKKQVNFRILLAILLQQGEAALVREKLNQHLNTELPDKLNLLDFSKNFYQYKRTEQAIYESWERIYGKKHPAIHLSWDQLNELTAKGWEIGNHTLSHCVLGNLNYEQQKYEIEQNEIALKKSGLPFVKWLSYPYGSAKHVNAETLRWMEENKDWNGIFAKGGVNSFFCRTEWMRIGVGDYTIDDFKKRLKI